MSEHPQLPPASSPELDLSPEAQAAGGINTTAVLAGQAPSRPNITPAQIVGMIPVLADLGHSFGIFALNAGQQASLSRAVYAGMALFGADAILRGFRNLARR